MTLLETYKNLPTSAQHKTRQLWMREFWKSRSSFYTHLQSPTAEDFVFFATVWGVELASLMQDISVSVAPVFTRRSPLTLATIATQTLLTLDPV